VVTVTSTVPDPAGEVAVIVVPLTTVTFVAAEPPNMTVAGPANGNSGNWSSPTGGAGSRADRAGPH
jgi:hypothetical protein